MPKELLRNKICMLDYLGQFLIIVWIKDSTGTIVNSIYKPIYEFPFPSYFTPCLSNWVQSIWIFFTLFCLDFFSLVYFTYICRVNQPLILVYWEHWFKYDYLNTFFRKLLLEFFLLSHCHSVCLSFFLSVLCMSVHLSFHQSVFPTVHYSITPSVP